MGLDIVGTAPWKEYPDALENASIMAGDTCGVANNPVRHLPFAITVKSQL